MSARECSRKRVEHINYLVVYNTSNVFDQNLKFGYNKTALMDGLAEKSVSAPRHRRLMKVSHAMGHSDQLEKQM